MTAATRTVLRALALAALCTLALQLYFLGRVACMIVVDPQSTSFQRSEAWRMASARSSLSWHQQWRDYAHLSAALKRAVIASEDAGFAEHSGVEWDALERAWERNQEAEAKFDLSHAAAKRHPAASATAAAPKIVGGSTITQQLAKNLFLDAERNLFRKAQEFMITFMLEGLLSKARILEIYLNSVEWGEGVFGADAAAQHYFRVDAAHLSAQQAAQLAVMLPAPKRFEKRPASPYVLGRAATVGARMGGVELP